MASASPRADRPHHIGDRSSAVQSDLRAPTARLARRAKKTSQHAALSNHPHTPRLAIFTRSAFFEDGVTPSRASQGERNQISKATNFSNRLLQRVQEDFVMNTVNNAANFNGQKPVIDPGDAVLLLIDHQSGLFQTVKDMEMTSCGPTPRPSPRSRPWPRSPSSRAHPYHRVQTAR